MKIGKRVIIMVISLLMSVFGRSVWAVIYSVESYEASIKRGRFISDTGRRLEYSKRIVLLRGVRNFLDLEKWRKIKMELSKGSKDFADLIAAELNVMLKDVQAILPELKLAFEVSHLYKEIVSNLDNMQAAYANLSTPQRSRR